MDKIEDILIALQYWIAMADKWIEAEERFKPFVDDDGDEPYLDDDRYIK